MRIPLRIRLLLVMSALVAAALGAAGWLLVDVNRAAVEDATREGLFGSIDDLANTVDRGFADYGVELTTIARVLVDESLDADQRISLIASQIEASPELAAVGIFDEDGSLVDEVREPEAPARHATTLSLELRTAALARPVAIGSVNWIEERPSLRVVVAATGAATTWFVVADVGVQPLQARVEQLVDDRFGGDADALAVVDRDLRIVAHADPERVGQRGERWRNWLQPAMFDQPVAVALFREFDDEHGRVVAAARNLPETGWVVISQRRHATVYASIPRMRRAVVTVMVATLLLAVVVAFVVARRVTRPIARLVEYAGALADRQWQRTISVRTGDELEALARALSAAATDLADSERGLERERRIRGDLGRYLSTQLVDQIVREPRSLQLGGERRALTVLFADVASFTGLAEQLAPERTVQLLNHLFSILTEIVFRHGGTVDKFLGDCVMAFWGAPIEQPDHAKLAVAAARDMMRWLEVGNEVWASELGVTIHLAIGINSGEAIVGNLGSESRMEYTCIGDVVNVAARLEGMARPQQILTSSATRDAAPNGCRPLGTHTIAGRTEAIAVFEVAQ